MPSKSDNKTRVSLKNSAHFSLSAVRSISRSPNHTHFRYSRSIWALLFTSHSVDNRFESRKKDFTFKANAEVFSFQIKWALSLLVLVANTFLHTKIPYLLPWIDRRWLLHGNHEITMNTNRFVSITKNKEKRFLFSHSAKYDLVFVRVSIYSFDGKCKVLL